ncbi:MAG: helix-turn-helix domain-containing protein [Streptosporangiales bacterium]|nr:helix-turn-helix domain-containing protein [Streptosporangiales bacterium]
MSRTSRRPKLTIEDICDDLRISRSTFYDWRQKGRAPKCHRLPNGGLRVDPDDYDAWLRSCEDGA